jgi:putative transposase
MRRRPARSSIAVAGLRRTEGIAVPIPLSLLDLAWVPPGQTVEDALRGSVHLAKAAERAGYLRVWYTEHHNAPTVASSSPAVLIGQVAANTESIHVGAGGVLLPYHSPLVVAEQFGTLATFYPGRIDLGVGRAGGDSAALLRSRNPFARDIAELHGYLTGASLVPGVQAVPRAEQPPQIFILGSSLNGAHIAARSGFPYAFASHFAPDLLHEAQAAYRDGFRPSEQFPKPYVMLGVGVFAANDAETAQRQRTIAFRERARDLLALAGRGAFTDAQLDALLASPEGAALTAQNRYTATGTAADVRDYLNDFAQTTGADELILVHGAMRIADRVRSVELTGLAMA